MKYGSFDTRFGKYMRLLPLLLAILLFASTSSAASLCVDGDTLANYFAAGSCYVNAGLGVQVLFDFTPTGGGFFNYKTDSVSDPLALGLTKADIQVFGVTGPGVPEAGLRFQTSLFTVPTDASYVDVTLNFGVSVYVNPPDSHYLFDSAHLGLNASLGRGSDDFIAAGEVETLHQVFNLGLTNPPDPGDISDQIYSVQSRLTGSIDLFSFGPGSQITSWVESYDLVNTPEPGTLALIPGAVILFGLLRKKRYAKSILPVLALLTLFAAKSHANALCTDLTAINGAPVGAATDLTIDKYISYTTNFGGCSMNDMLFRFTSFTTAGTGAVIPTAANTSIDFTLINSPNATNMVQLEWLPVAATSLASQTLSVTFQYTVTAPTYQLTKMTGTTTVTGTPTPTRSTTIVPDTSPAASGSPFNGANPEITFNNPLSTTFSVTDVVTLAGAAKHFSGADDQFTEVVPEPVTSLLMGSSLLGLGFLSRKRKA